MSQQSLRQASIRAVTSTTYTYEGDWHALWDLLGIAAGQFNERMLAYINNQLSTSYTELNGAMAAFAAEHGSTTFQAIGTFTPGFSLDALTLAWSTAASDNTPGFEVSGDSLDLAPVGAQIELQVADDVNFTPPPNDTELSAVTGNPVTIAVSPALSDGQYWARARLLDSGDAPLTAWSNVVTETIATTFDPASLFVTYSDGFWLDAALGTCTDFVGTGQAGVVPSTTDAAVILSWNDQSGNGRHFSVAGSGPQRKNSIVNSLPVLRFAGSSSGLGGATLAGLGSAAEIFMVVKIDNDPPGAVAQSGLWHLGASASANHYPLNSDSTIYDGTFASARKTVGDPTPALTSFRLVNVWSASADWSFLLDGTALYATGTNTVGFGTTPLIGQSAGAQYLDGDIAEIICFNAKLTAGERTSMKAYFATKYALTIA